MAAACIYKADLPRVIAPRNQLDLSLSKHIRYRIIAKINGKRNNEGGEILDALVACGYSLLLFLWWPHIFIGKTCLGLQCLITDYVYLYQNVLDY
jgi:hypothetical protein